MNTKFEHFSRQFKVEYFSIVIDKLVEFEIEFESRAFLIVTKIEHFNQHFPAEAHEADFSIKIEFFNKFQPKSAAHKAIFNYPKIKLSHSKAVHELERLLSLKK